MAIFVFLFWSFRWNIYETHLESTKNLPLYLTVYKKTYAKLTVVFLRKSKTCKNVGVSEVAVMKKSHCLMKIIWSFKYYAQISFKRKTMYPLFICCPQSKLFRRERWNKNLVFPFWSRVWRSISEKSQLNSIKIKLSCDSLVFYSSNSVQFCSLGFKVKIPWKESFNKYGHKFTEFFSMACHKPWINKSQFEAF